MLLTPKISKNNTSFRKAIPFEKRVAVHLWRLATGNAYRCNAKTFATGKSIAVKISKDFCSALRQQFCTCIKFPDSAVATKHAIETFKVDYNCKIPQSLGAIDWTHIFIKGPNFESKYDYYCTKQRYSINTQAVLVANLNMPKKRVLRQTNLFEMNKSGEILQVSVKKIRNAEVRPLILGDKS